MQGKVALISGGAEGLGAATARRFVEEGAAVMLADIQIEKAEALAAELGAAASAIALDVTSLAAWEAAVAATIARFGKLTTLCNIAGISEPGSVEDVPLDSWARTIDINLNGTFYGCRAAIPAMVASAEDCTIVNFGSMLALRPGSGFASYCASKAGVTMLTKSIALHCAKAGHRIRANTVHPGAIDTPMYRRYLDNAPIPPDEMAKLFAANHPMGRVGQPDEIAEAVLYLASDASSFTTGTDLTVDGGGNFRE